MNCEECGELLYYSGGCMGEWEHLGDGECKKEDIRNYKMVNLKLGIERAQLRVDRLKAKYKAVMGKK